MPTVAGNKSVQWEGFLNWDLDFWVQYPLPSHSLRPPSLYCSLVCACYPHLLHSRPHLLHSHAHSPVLVVLSTSLAALSSFDTQRCFTLQAVQDTAGQESLLETRKIAYHDHNVVLVAYDMTNRRSLTNIVGIDIQNLDDFVGESPVQAAAAAAESGAIPGTRLLLLPLALPLLLMYSLDTAARALRPAHLQLSKDSTGNPGSKTHAT